MTVDVREVAPRATVAPVLEPPFPHSAPATTGHIAESTALERMQRGAGLLAPTIDAITVAGVALACHASLPAATGAAAAALLVVGAAHGYGDHSLLTTRGLRWVTRAAMFAAAAVCALLALSGARPRAAIATSLAVAVAMAAIRAALTLAVSAKRRDGVLLHPALVVGAADAGRRVAGRIRLFPECGLRVAQVLDVADETHHEIAMRLVSQGFVREVVITDGVTADRLTDLLVAASRRRVHFTAVLAAPSLLGAHALGRVGDLGAVPLGRTAPGRLQHVAKRALDVVGATALLVVTSPLLAVVALLVRRTGSNVLYRQARVGRGGKPFTIFKLRTMVPDADNIDVTTFATPTTDGLLFKLENDPRVLPIGRHLRRLGIDELPQLWNVLRGQMSLVGPRPLAVDPQAFEARAEHRHVVRPGVTGPWQVAGGNTLRYADMVNIDVSYAATWSLRRDLDVLLRTVATVLIRRSPY